MTKISKTSAYPYDTTPNPYDYVIGTNSNANNRTNSYTIAAIADVTAQLMGGTSVFTKLVSVENIIQAGSTVTITNAVYLINSIEYTEEITVINIPSAASGYYRTDFIVGTSNGIALIMGVPDTENPVDPTLPLNNVLITRVNVFGNAVEPPAPEPTDDFKRKSNEASNSITATGDLISLGWGSKDCYRFVGGDDLFVRSLSILSAGDLYDGRLFTAVNSSEYTIVFEHNSGELGTELLFYMPAISNFILRPDCIVTFRYSSLSNRLELYSFSNSVPTSGLPLTIKFKGFTDGILNKSATLESNDTCYGEAEFYDEDRMMFVLTNVDSAKFLGGDNLDPNNYRLISSQQLE